MTTSVYKTHRSNQKERILEVSEDLFIDKGIRQVTLNDIAAAAHMTRATVYKYFSNKEEIAGEIFQNITRGWVDRDARDVWNSQGTGFELIRKFTLSQLNYIFENRREVRFVAEFNYLYAKEMTSETAMLIFARSIEGERARLFQNIESGQRDGSLRTDFTPEMLLASLLNFISGMMNRAGELGEKLEAEYGIPDKIIFEKIFLVFLDGLKT